MTKKQDPPETIIDDDLKLQEIQRLQQLRLGIPPYTPPLPSSSIILTVASRTSFKDYYYKIIGERVEVYKKQNDKTPFIITSLSNVVIYPI